MNDVIGYYTSERYQIEHISAIVQTTDTWSAGRPLCGRVRARAVFASSRPRSALAELRCIVDTDPRPAFTRCKRCQVLAEWELAREVQP